MEDKDMQEAIDEIKAIKKRNKNVISNPETKRKKDRDRKNRIAARASKANR